MRAWIEAMTRLFLMLDLFLAWIILLEVILLGGVPYLVPR